ncbi:MAG TPA: hypothetical protein VF508_00680 [Pyrinomonadaceae bacterium]|jgi:hypothetical protein
MRREKILVAVVLLLLYVLAGRAGLLEGVRAVNFGAFLFPKRGHADGIDLLLSAAINLLIYGALAYLIASALVWLFRKLKGR